MRKRLKARLERFLERPGTTVDIRSMRELLPEVTAEGERVAELTDEELTAEAQALRTANSEGSGKKKDDTRPMVAACALAREAAARGLGERPFDVQLVAAMAMLSGH